MNDDTNMNLPLRPDVLLRLTVYSELTSYVPLNSCLAGKNLGFFGVQRNIWQKPK